MTMRTPSAIEAESYRRLRAACDLSALPPLSRRVAERVIHASGDIDWAGDLVLDEAALRRGLAALRSGASVVVDVTMVAAGITTVDTVCGLATADASADANGLTRSAAGIRAALTQVGPGGVYVVGNAPTALFELLAHPEAAPALVVGLPVGWVGAVESKQALREAGWPAVTNRSRKGGSAVAAAALNALLYLEEEPV